MRTKEQELTLIRGLPEDAAHKLAEKGVVGGGASFEDLRGRVIPASGAWVRG